MTKWYDCQREQDYQNLYEYSGVGVVENDLDLEFRKALREGLHGKIIEVRHEYRKALSPVLLALGVVKDTQPETGGDA